MEKVGDTVKSTNEKVDEVEKKTKGDADDTKGGLFDGGFFKSLFGGDDDDDDDDD